MTMTYDLNDNLLSQSDPLGCLTSYSYGQTGKGVTSTGKGSTGKGVIVLFHEYSAA